MKSIFEEHGGRYIQCGDYLIPELGLTEQEQKPLGKYGMMRRKYLEENRSGLYTRMILSGTLYEHLTEIDETCHQRLDQMITQMAKEEGITRTAFSRSAAALIMLKQVENILWPS